MALLQRNLIQPQDRHAPHLFPPHLPADPAIHYRFDRFVPEVFFDPDILNRGMNQLQEQIFLIGFGVGTFRCIPRELLGGGWSPFTPWTPIAFRAQADIDAPAQNGEMAERDRLIESVQLRNHTPTLATLRPL